MSFADPRKCPSCDGAIAGGDHCPYCRFDLASPAARELWQTLLHADSLLTRAKLEQWTTAPPAEPAPPMPRPSPSMPVAPTRRWSTGSIILGLGALCLLVAAFVFITVSWDVLGATGRTLVLLVITSALGLAAAWSTRAHLRASAEALWAVFFGLFTIDFFAARAYDLFGLDALSDEQATLVFGISAALVGGVIVLISRDMLTVRVPSIAAGFAVWTASFALAATVDWPFFWSGFAGLTLAAAAAAIAWQLSLTLISRIAAVATAVFYVITTAGAIEEVAESPHLAQLAGDGHGTPMVVMIVVTAAMGLAMSRIAIPAAALVTLGVSSLVFAPSEAAFPHEGGFIAASALAVVLAFALIRGANDGIRGARIAGAAILTALAVASLGWLANAVEAIGTSNDSGFGTSWTVRLHNSDQLSGPGWLAFLTFAAIGAAAWAVRRWPELRAHLKMLVPVPAVVAGLGLVVGVTAYEPPVVFVALLVLALGVGMLVLVRPEHDMWLGFALLVTALPTVMTFASKPITLVLWVAAAAVLVAVAIYFSVPWARQVSSFGATALFVGAATLAGDLASVSEPGVRIVAVIVAIAALVLASYTLRHFVGRGGIELAAGICLAVTLLSGIDVELGSQALIFTVAGVPLVVLGLLVKDRNWLRYVGSAALGVAWVMRLVASDVSTVEAYTAPFAVVLLAAGLYAMRGNPQLRTAIALTPGLALAFVPSLPQALDDPTGLRALLLGVAAVIALGIGLWRSWQMPFVFGTVVLVLLVLWNVGPVANGLPRWILIAVAGIVLIGSGISWEKRVQNAKSATKFVQNLQ